MPETATPVPDVLQSRSTFPSRCQDFADRYRGSQYFTDLARFLAEEVGISYVLIGYPDKKQHNQVRTVVLYAGGEVASNISYPLSGTPCENVIGRNCCYYPTGIQQMFPSDKELRDLNIDSYIGFPLFNDARNPIGIIVLMDTKMIPLAGAVEDGLRALAPRTAQELEQHLLENGGTEA
ncbi:hypothetical protein [Flaviaesturariibacter amylovorans]|uniref:GAF domain-containing protein n=1 Tax=Flaviaesturariibacter amylovorans TaxID=1084520 RepID=A0ABP8G8H2_9BACT